MSHQSVTVDTWNAVENFRRDITTQQETDQNRSRLDNITWRYHNSAKQKRLSHCGSTCQPGKLCYVKGRGQVSTKNLESIIIY
jgi:hypothetical protein